MLDLAALYASSLFIAVYRRILCLFKLRCLSCLVWILSLRACSSFGISNNASRSVANSSSSFASVNSFSLSKVISPSPVFLNLISSSWRIKNSLKYPHPWYLPMMSISSGVAFRPSASILFIVSNAAMFWSSFATLPPFIQSGSSSIR